MRAFVIKAISILIVALMLFMYQTTAHSYAQMNAAVDELKAELTKQMEQADANNKEPEYKDGTYRGSGTGYSGELTVEVTVKDGKIAAIEIVSSKDDKAYLELASGLLDEIMASGSADEVAAVSGATLSSKGIIEAMKDALEEAAE